MWTHGCVFSAAHHTVGHLVVMVYIHSGGVPYKLQASRVMLLALHCFHIPSPVGSCVANKGKPWKHHVPSCSFLFSNVHSCQWMNFGFIGWCVHLCYALLGLLALSLTHVDAWLCILSSPPHCWASCCHGVYPQWWRPIQTAGKSSHAPCIALLPYS